MPSIEGRLFARRLWFCIIALFCVISNPVMAVNFEVLANQNNPNNKDLDGADQTGAVRAGGTLSNPQGTDRAVIAVTRDGSRSKIVSEGAINNLHGGANAHGISVAAGANNVHIVLKTGSTMTLLAAGPGGSDGIFTEGDDTKIEIEGGTIDTANLAVSHGVHSTGARLVLTISGGQITTAGRASHGIFSAGADAKIIISGGQITTAGRASHGIFSAGADAKITISGGQITTAVRASHGILSVGADAKITISGGQITTAVRDSHGILSRGIEATIKMSGGEISTTGNNFANGILSRGNNAKLTISGGKISTAGRGSRGILSMGADAKITISGGEIATQGASGNGIVSRGTDATLTMSGGKISTTGRNARGVSSTGDDFTFSMSGGEISTTGNNFANGILSRGNNAKLTISGGKISTAGNTSNGIVSRGATSTIKISGGEISTAGTDSHGLLLILIGDLVADNNLNANPPGKGYEHLLEVGGLISTKGAHSHGIYIQNRVGTSRARLDISGSVIVEGLGSIGVLIEDQTGDITQFEISGRIEAKQGADANSKPITIKKADAVNLALKIDINKNARIIGNIEMGVAGGGNGDDDDTINLMDTAKIKGDVNMGAGADTLTLDGDSIIIGNIDMGGDNDTVKLSKRARVIGVIDGGANEDTLDLTGSMVADRRAADSFSLRYKNFENVKGVPTPSKKNYLVGINFKGQAGYDAAKETRLVHIEPTGQAAETRALSGLNDALHDLGGRRLDGGSGQRYAGRPVQLAARERIPKHLFQDSRPSAWAEFFGAAQRRGKDGYAKAYALDYRGIAAGLEQDFRGARLGFLLGYASTTFKTRPASIKTDSRSFFAGMYGRHTLDNYLEDAYLQGALNFSYNDHDNRRRVLEAQSIVIAKGEYKSWALSPSLTLGRNFRLNNEFSLEPSVDLRYSVGFYDDYSEKGLQQRQDALSIKERTQQSLLGLLNLAGVYQLPGEAGRVALRFGLSHRRHFASDLKGRVGDKAFTFDNAGSTTVNLMQAGLDVAVNVTDALSVNARWEYATNLGGVSDHTNRAQLFAVYRF